MGLPLDAIYFLFWKVSFNSNALPSTGSSAVSTDTKFSLRIFRQSTTLIRFGPTFGAAQVPFVLIASALSLVTYTVTHEIGGARRHARIAALLTIFSGFYLVFWTNTEAFAPFALTASLTLLLVARARRANRAWMWLAAGALSALGHLSRADGPLLLLVALLVAGWPGHGTKAGGR